MQAAAVLHYSAHLKLLKMSLKIVALTWDQVNRGVNMPVVWCILNDSRAQGLFILDEGEQSQPISIELAHASEISEKMVYPQLPYSLCSFATCTYETTMSVYMPHMNLMQSKICDQEHRYTHISHYWHMPLNKYASHITHVCPTVFLLWSTYIPHITEYTSPKRINNL